MSPAAILVPLAAAGDLDTKAQIVAVLVTVLLLGLVLDLVRRRLLAERYALLWMSVSIVLLVLAIWTDLLSGAADLVGISTAANALFLAAFGVAFVLLLHFSVATSRLAEESKILAQEVARLDQELRRMRTASENGAGQPPERSTARTTDQ
jgi:hypothetical protein